MRAVHVLTMGIAMVGATISLTARPSSSAPEDEEIILASERAWANAPVKNDADGMAHLMSDDYVEIVSETAPSSGKTRWTTKHKAEWVDLVRSGRDKYKSVELNNLKVYLHGDVASVTGEYAQTGTEDGQDISATGLYVDTWVKKNGRWLVVSSVFP